MTIQPTKELRIVQSDVQVMDPHVLSDNRDRRSILSAIYESLVRRGLSGSFTPCLAANWKTEGDATDWTFKLRKDVIFHDGNRLSAGDVVASLERICDPALGGELGTQGVYRSYLGDAIIKALSNYEVSIVLPEPMADLLDLLVDIPIVSENALDDLPKVAVGSGPYSLSESGNHRLLMERFLEYWGGQPPVQEAHWLAESDASKRISYLLAGEVDIASDIEPNGTRAINDSGKNQVVEAGAGTCVIFMCNARSGVCSNIKVRQALNYALDIPRIINQVRGGAAQPLDRKSVV